MKTAGKPRDGGQPPGLGEPRSRVTIMSDTIDRLRPSRLGLARRGYRGVIRRVDAAGLGSSLADIELESRLLEIGFVEGARVEVLHEGAVGRDPIAVRVDNITMALRRREAMAIVLSDPD